DGIVSFLHEKYRPKGGPDGGNGGRGGDVFLVADENVGTLRDFAARRLFSAEDGGRGGSNTKAGAAGEDLFVKVPVGTLVRETPAGKTPGVFEDSTPGVKEAGVFPTGTLLFDLVKHGQTALAASGGAGGRGNHALRSSGNRAPRESEVGLPGEERLLFLELKLLADVGIVGLPNAGKTTLLNALTRARGEVGSYPFTTLEPNLGVMREVGEIGRPVSTRSIRGGLILADIPGLIEGASAGRGLGDQFLKHIERTRILVHLLDGGRAVNCASTSKNVVANFPPATTAVGHVGRGSSRSSLAPLLWQDYQMINQELKNYHSALAEKEQIVVLNKIDLPAVSAAYPQAQEFFGDRGVKLLAVSAVVSEGLAELKKEILRRAEEKSPKDKSRPIPQSQALKKSQEPGSYPWPALGNSDSGESVPVKTYRLRDLPNRRIIFESHSVEGSPRLSNPRRRNLKG
ncbi:GTPase ObgE, partial [Candidatus Parcubacteria bacterium]|nr:GTPase ObgE [Candidatus Parcubacteria bacterium]